MGWEKSVEEAAANMTLTLRLDRKKVLKKLLDKDEAGDFMATAIERSVQDLNLGDLSYAPDKAFCPFPCEEITENEPSSSFLLPNDVTHNAGNVDRWMLGSTETGVQGSRVPVVQRSTLAARSSFSMSRAWYVLALALPLFSFNSSGTWRCSPSQVISSAELFLANIATVVGRARANVSRLAQQQMTRDCFAMAMDIVLVVYAFGFLLLSLYQASIIG